MMFLTKKRMEHMRAIPTLLRVLMDTIPTSTQPDKGLIGTMRAVWPTRRGVSRIFLDWPGWASYPGDIQDLIGGAVREAERLGLVRTQDITNVFGHLHEFVGYLPETRRDCLPAPEAHERRGMHCRENCEHDSRCPFTHGGLNHVV